MKKWAIFVFAGIQFMCAAAAADMPKELIGNYNEISDKTLCGKEQDFMLQIKQQEVTFGLEVICKPGNVVKEGKGNYTIELTCNHEDQETIGRSTFSLKGKTLEINDPTESGGTVFVRCDP